MFSRLGCAGSTCSRSRVRKSVFSSTRGCAASVSSLVSSVDETGLPLAWRGKRINRARVLAILDQGLNRTAPLEAIRVLCGAGHRNDRSPSEEARCRGFSAVSRNSAEDLRDKADYLGIVWTKKHGRAPAFSDMGICDRSCSVTPVEPSKPRNVKTNPLGSRCSRSAWQVPERRQDGSQLYDCSNRHLEGFAYSLTIRVQDSVEPRSPLGG